MRKINMIYISCATYLEAKYLIKVLKLKKDLYYTKFQVFKNKDIMLFITKTGIVDSCICISHIFSKNEIKESDILINVGICACVNQNINIGDIFIINKIIEHDTKKTFYPDIIFSHSFKENSIETFSEPVNNSNKVFKGNLIDMEASAVYQSAQYFLCTHQIVFIKIVSDYLSENVNIEKIEYIFNRNIEELINFILSVKNLLNNKKELFSKEEILSIENISEKLNLSVTMNLQLKQIIKYYKLISKSNISDVINNFSIQNKLLENITKNERKQYFEKLKREFI